MDDSLKIELIARHFREIMHCLGNLGAIKVPTQSKIIVVG